MMLEKSTMTFDREKIIRSGRLSISLLITFFITWYFEIPEGMWALITCCFVVFEFTTWGGVSTKSWMRFIATFFSAVYSILVIYFFGNNAVINLIALIVGVFIYGYLFLDKKEVYVSVLGCVTLTLTLINYNHIDAGLLRPFNIALGILISLLTFKFFYPAYAREKIMVLQWDYMGHLRQIMEDFLDSQISLEALKERYLSHENDLLKSIATFARLIEEAKMEMKEDSLFIQTNVLAFEHCRRIYRLMSVLVYHLLTKSIRENVLIDAEQIKMNLAIIQANINIAIKPSDTSYNQTELLKNIQKSDDTISDQQTAFVKMLMLEITEQMVLYDKKLMTIIPICLNRYRED